MQGVNLFITITDRSRADQFASWFRSHGISLVLTALGEGTATTEVLDYLGLEATEKAVLFCVAPRSPRMVRQAARELWLDVPGQGVLMTVPVNRQVSCRTMPRDRLRSAFLILLILIPS